MQRKQNAEEESSSSEDESSPTVAGKKVPRKLAGADSSEEEIEVFGAVEGSSRSHQIARTPQSVQDPANEASVMPRQVDEDSFDNVPDVVPTYTSPPSGFRSNSIKDEEESSDEDAASGKKGSLTPAKPATGMSSSSFTKQDLRSLMAFYGAAKPSVTDAPPVALQELQDDDVEGTLRPSNRTLAAAPTSSRPRATLSASTSGARPLSGGKEPTKQKPPVRLDANPFELSI